MARLGRRLLVGTLVFAAIVLVVAVWAAVFLDVNRYKPSIENAVSTSLGVEFRIRGNVALHLLPLPRLKVRDIRLTNGTSELLSAEELQVSPRLLPFIFHRRISIDRLTLQRPQIRLEQPITIPLRPGKMSSISVQDGTFSYLDQSSGRSIEVRGLEVKLSDLSLGESDGLQSPALLRSLSLRGTLHAATVQIGTLRASEVRSGVRAEAGLLQLDPTDVTLFGGDSHGSLTLDLRRPSPRIQVVQVAPQLDLGQVFPGEKTYFSGTVQASFDVVGTGTDLKAITKTTQGHVAIRGEHLSIEGWDVDQLIEDYNRTQKFSLIDLGAVLVAGPFGPLLTKGSDFARLYGGMGEGKSEIRTLVSDWAIVDGIATAKDVAFSTGQNTVAFQGDVNLVNGGLRGFFVATVDPRGCAQVKQQITGTLTHPDAPGVASKSLFGPIGSVIQGALDLVKSDRCDLFYSGSALP